MDTVFNCVLTNKSEQTIKLTEYGFTLHFPKGSLRARATRLHIGICTSDHFTYSEEYELVSPIYLIDLNSKLCDPVTMEIKHCSTDYGNLHFLHAHSDKKFKPLSGGNFNRYSGTIHISEFSWFVIARIKEYLHRNTRYYAQVFITKGLTKKKMHFLVTRHLHSYIMVSKFISVEYITLVRDLHFF